PGLYAGREHFIYNDDKDSEALAWYKVFDRDTNGVWAKDDGLTDIGAEAIRNKRYKFTSFVANRSDLEALDGNRYRVLGIDTVGFTNMANGREWLAPITNREAFPVVEAGDSKKQTKKERQKMTTVLTELGLSPDASEESALAAVHKLKNRLTAVEPFEAQCGELKDRVADLDGAQIAAMLQARGVTEERVINRLQPVLAGMAKVTDREGFLDDCGYQRNGGAKQTRLYNRDGAQPSEAAARIDRAAAERIMNRAREIRKEHANISLPTAITMAKRELAA
ncbi:MAG: phage protease, partial [Limisphaerales bacterium]